MMCMRFWVANSKSTPFTYLCCAKIHLLPVVVVVVVLLLVVVAAAVVVVIINEGEVETGELVL